jgi:hypothetical protein
MKYDVEMGSRAIIYIPSFRNIDSGIQRLIRGDSQTYRQDGDRISLLLFFGCKESRLKMDFKETGYVGVGWIHLTQGQ